MKNILLVEDSTLIREGISKILDKAGYTVFEANDGKEALTVFATNEIDLVITDILMPNMCGIDLITKLGELFPEIPVIAMSGGARYNNSVNCLEAAVFFGASRTIEKPFKPVQLIDLISSISELDKNISFMNA